MERQQVWLDVTRSSGIEGARLAATVIHAHPGPRPVVAIALPGGGYSRGYWDIDWPGDYSEAAFHAERGWVFVAVDHLGVGESSQPDPDGITFDMLADTTAEAVDRIRTRLLSGSLAPGLHPCEPRAVIGIGQSMGGCVTILAQARHTPYDAIAVLGFSAIHTVLPTPDGGAQVDRISADQADSELLAARAEELSMADVFSHAFHWDVEPELLEADLGDGFPFRLGAVPSWGSATVPPAAVAMLSEGIVAKEAAQIAVPVFIGAGERDVCPDVDREPAAYPVSGETTLAVIPRMAHMHNFHAGRTDLWARLQQWGDELRPS